VAGLACEKNSHVRSFPPCFLPECSGSPYLADKRAPYNRTCLYLLFAGLISRKFNVESFHSALFPLQVACGQFRPHAPCSAVLKARPLKRLVREKPVARSFSPGGDTGQRPPRRRKSAGKLVKRGTVFLPPHRSRCGLFLNRAPRFPMRKAGCLLPIGKTWRNASRKSCMSELCSE
jgi:hypothetical protein